MGDAACDALAVELALDLLEAQLAVELPPHMRAFSHAYAIGRSPPSAPAILRYASTLQTARNARVHDVLAERGLALLRLVGPLLIEDDPGVRVARSAPVTWPGLAILGAARDAAAARWFGVSAVELLHRLHGTGSVVVNVTALSPAIAAWHASDVAIDSVELAYAWQTIATRLGVAGSVRIERSAASHPRTFVIVPGAEVIVVVPERIDTPATRFSVLHELGHVALALALPTPVSRVLDEATAAYVAADSPRWLPPLWGSKHAAIARKRRTAIACVLDTIERALPKLPEPPPSTAPPWALWHDPGAQASYVAAEVIADRLHRELGPDPRPGQLARVVADEHDRMDRASGV